MERKMEIIGEMARMGMVEEIAANVTRNSADDTVKDLCQMTYLSLMEKDGELIEGLWDRGQMRYFVSRMIVNSWHSKTSRYYYVYKKFPSMCEEIGNTSEEDDEYGD